jgi:hypothetical protein
MVRHSLMSADIIILRERIATRSGSLRYPISVFGVLPMPKRGKISANRRPPPGASPVGTRQVQPGGAASAPRFTALSEAQWQAILRTHNWPDKGIDWRREIDGIGQDHWEAVDTRERWVKKLQGKKPANQRKKIDQALAAIRQSEKALAVLVADGLLDDDFPHPNLSHPEHCLKEWLSDYDMWVQPFAGTSNPILAELEWQLIGLWKTSGGKLAYSRTKEKGRTDTGRRATPREHRRDHADPERPNTPYAPLVDFLKLTLNAILGDTYSPSGIAKMIDRYRGERGKLHPFLVFRMKARIAGSF